MIMAALGLSWEREVGRQGAAEALAGLSGRRGEEEEVDVERRSQEEALEVGVVLSEQEGQVDLREKQGHQTKERKNVLDDTKSNK